MFDRYDNDRLTAWREFRDSLEESQTPFQDVADFWGRAPFVNTYLDPQNPKAWPDPWHLVLDNKYDDLAITLGMLYTIKLTQRFIDTEFEIHMTTLAEDRSIKFLLIVDRQYVLNLEYRSVVAVENLPEVNTKILWAGSNLL